MKMPITLAALVVGFLATVANSAVIPIRGDSGHFPNGSIPGPFVQWNVEVPQNQVQITFDAFNLSEHTVLSIQQKCLVPYFFNGVLNYIQSGSDGKRLLNHVPFVRSIGDATVNISLITANPLDNDFTANFKEINVTTNVSRIVVPVADSYTYTRKVDPGSQKDYTEIIYLRMPYPVSTDHPLLLSVSCSLKSPNYLQIYTYTEINPGLAQSYNWFAHDANEEEFVLQFQNVLFVAHYDQNTYQPHDNQSFSITFDRKSGFTTTYPTTPITAASAIGASIVLVTSLASLAIAGIRA